MPKFLFEDSYTQDGLKGVQSAGVSSRRGSIATMVEGMGGKLESFYCGFGETDVYALADLPGTDVASAIALAINGSGGATVKLQILVTPAEVDAAAERAVLYRPPGA